MSPHAPEELDVVPGLTNFVAIKPRRPQEFEMSIADAAGLQMCFQRRLGKALFATDRQFSGVDKAFDPSFDKGAKKAF